MISVVAKLTVQEGKAEETIAAFQAMLPDVAQEPGTLLYSLNRNPKDPNTIVVIERYKDKDALAAHSATPHFKAFSQKLGGVLAGRPDISVLEEIDLVSK
ncbi:MAG: antibiotic biosynthesis monooxygenase [Desulfatitalea sp.]|nr:antibiotic biosynthesis monooxygenase [Desulfatitalea sp.]